MNRKLLLLSSLLILTSCSKGNEYDSSNNIDSNTITEGSTSTISSNSDDSSSKQEETLDDLIIKMLNSTPEISFENYQKCLAICNELYNTYDTQTYKKIKTASIDKSWSEKSANLYLSYWQAHSKLMKALKQVLQNDANFIYYNSRIENCDFYKNLDENNFYVDRDYADINLDELVNLGTSIENALDNSSITKEDLAKKLEQYDHSFGSLLNNKQLSSLQSDIFADDETLQDLSATYDEKYNDLLNTYKAIFKKALLNDKYKDYIYTYFDFTEEDYQFFIDVEIYDAATMALLNKETELVSSYEKAYNMEDSSFNYAQNYLDLVAIRNQIAKAMGYSNYYEYAFKEVYDRDYSVKEASNLTSNILNSTDLNMANDLLYEAIVTKYNELMTSYLKESDLIEMLTYCQQIEPRAKQALLELETYGNYNFEYRNNKYGGSYVCTIDSNSNRFILVNRSGTIMDYSTVSHEFGHYTALTQSDPNLEGDTYSLDICEVHSQGMEYLMTNFYSSLLEDRKKANLLTNYEIYNAIWTLQSGSAIASFEEYAYTTSDTLTTSKLMEKSNELLGGIGTTVKYYDIPHIFSSPAYYISYVTSLIAALELFSMNFNDAIKSYQTIVSYGESNNFKFVLNKANLKDPFTDDAWKTVLAKIKSVAGVN